ncbi:MAG: CTP synthase [Candidatus Lokiarchaeota archaeon]|nr:CTP synthase [Candidatus Lokiarchaeota archaeon]
MTKYIFVTGGVMSAIGKGVTASSIGKIFQFRNYDVSIIKIDPYLNVDPGTLNPVEHGEVFVTEDIWEFKPVEDQVYKICEIDQDFGTYERFLGKFLSPSSNMTSGQIYLSVILQERFGGFLGRTVQIIPHITDEIKKRIRSVAANENLDVLIVEVGGTVGDIEAMPFLEAIRQFRLEEKSGDTALVHVTLLPYSETVGELKTKPTQHSVKALLGLGLQPDVIIARSKIPLNEAVRKKLSLYCNVPMQAVISNPNIEVIYELPLIFENQDVGTYLSNTILKMVAPKPETRAWEDMIRLYKDPNRIVKIAMPGKYTAIQDSYVSINEALKHAAAHNNAKVEIDWIDTEPFEINPDKLQVLKNYDGMLMTPGFGGRGVEGMIRAISYALKENMPFLGICFGAQLMFCAYCRDYLGLKDASSTEHVPDTCNAVVDLMPEQKAIKDKGGTMRLGSHEIYIEKNTKLYEIYGKDVIKERFRHRFHIMNEYVFQAQDKGLIASAYDKDKKIINAIEMTKPDSWVLGVQFHPEYKSWPNKPSPIYYDFIKTCIERKS